MDIEPQHITIERRVRYAVLEPSSEPVSEVWFTLHGYNQLAHRFLRYFQPIHERGRLIIAAEGLHRQYVDHGARKVGASWMTSEDRLTDIEDYVAYLDRLYAYVFESRDLPLDLPVHALGFSQGVHTLYRWVALGISRIDRTILWGGTPPPDLDLVAHCPRLSSARLQLVSGDEDEFIDEGVIRKHKTRLREAGVPFKSHSYRGGHRIDGDMLRHLASD
jgi:predicted esterase